MRQLIIKHTFSDTSCWPSEDTLTYEPRHEKKVFFAYAKTKMQISCVLTSTFKIRSVKDLAVFCGRTARFVSDPVENPEDWFSHNEAHIKVL